MEKLIQKIKEVTGVTDVTSLSNHNPVVRVLAQILGVSISTILRWATGKTEPHKAILPIVLRELDNIRTLKELMKDAPWNKPSICRRNIYSKENRW
jgi:transcriptional regulator with XRE-family HTH domain